MRRVMFLMLAAGIAACGHGKQSGPAWPSPSTTAEDGGESIEPHDSSPVAAAIEKADESDDKKDEAESTEEKVDAASPAKDEPGQTPSASQPTQDDVIMTDEIIIEIED